MTRPDSLADVAVRAVTSASFHLHLRDFLDQFRRERLPDSLSAEPSKLER